MLDAALLEEFSAWFRLLETPGVSRDVARRLLAGLGSPDQVLSASPLNLRHFADDDVVRALAQRPLAFDERLQAAVAWLSGGEERHFLTLADRRFPPQLLQTADPPLLLYVQGQPSCLQLPSVAVVGSRRATAQGLDHAHRFAKAFAEAGLLVVSGLALGIDGKAHVGALAALPGGTGQDGLPSPDVQAEAVTVAVVGTGLDRVYPKRHHALAHAIARHGALVSEFAPGMPALNVNFPQRNRIIAGLTRGTLVVEAALQSGSLITARLASEAGREVWAIPGSIHAEQSRGCHALIRQGAALVEQPSEIIDELSGTGRAWAHAAASSAPGLRNEGLPPSVASPHLMGSTATSGTAPSSGPQAGLLEHLGADPVSLDALLARSGETVERLLASLLELELDGHVMRLPGGLYQRRFSA